MYWWSEEPQAPGASWFVTLFLGTRIPSCLRPYVPSCLPSKPMSPLYSKMFPFSVVTCCHSMSYRI